MDALYGLPLDEFTPSRDELAKELREAGEREQAAWVKQLPKPTAAAWLVNQLARTQRREARALIEAGDRLREAQEGVLAGRGSPDRLRAAAEDEGKAVRALLGRASGLLNREGRSPSPASLEKVEQTLRAVTVDEQTRAAFEVGRLTREGRAAGLGLLGAEIGDAPRDRKPAAGRSEERARAKRALEAAKAKLQQRRRAVASAERNLAKAQREAERSQRRLDEAAKKLERARADEADAGAAVADARAT